VADRADAFGRAVLDWTRGGETPEILERDDGFVDTGAGPGVYLASYGDWPAAERQAMRYVRGRVADIGCGAGRVSLHLQELEFDVTAFDASPLVVRACRQRGVRKVVQSAVRDLSGTLQAFDTILLMGNNFGIFGTPERARATLSTWARSVREGTLLVAESMDPYRSSELLTAEYRRRNRARGRLPGQTRLRIRYREFASPWFDWLFVSRSEMVKLVRGTGWAVQRLIGPKSSDLFVGVLERRASPNDAPQVEGGV
jgi:SAM-dependent methyltransferase